MDAEPSSDRHRVRPWAQAHGWGRAHTGVIRGLLQVVVILTGALGLWLIGVGPKRNEPLPATPPVVSWAPSQIPTVTVSVPTPAVSPPDVGPQDAGPQDAGPQDVVVSQDAASQDVISQDAPPQDAASQDVISQDAPPQDAASQDVISQDAPPQDAALQDAAPQDVAPQDVVSQDAPPQDAAPQDAAPQDVVSQDAPPQDAAPQDAPVRAGGEALPLASSDETSPGAAGAPVDGILPGLFSSILPTPVPSPTALDAPEATAQWVWPVRGELSQGYSSAHRAIDVSTEQGAVVVAADAGTVVYARWESTGYGYLVIIDHHNGFVSYYAHLYGFYIDVGYEVARGEQIGELGTTGRSTGPHIHFEIRQDGVQRDPLDLLP